jgi:hypothetical protein
MGWGENRLAVDGWGIHVGGSEFPIRSIPWAGVTAVRAYAVDFGGGEVSAVLELHHDGGPWEEVLSHWEDYPTVAAGLSSFLPGLRRDWRAMVQALPAGEAPITVWSRASEIVARPDR